MCLDMARKKTATDCQIYEKQVYNKAKREKAAKKIELEIWLRSGPIRILYKWALR